MKVNREYLSWSQYSLWNKSRREFYKRYCLGEESKPNKFFNKGNEIGNYLETGDIPFDCEDEMLQVVGDVVPKLDIMEDKLTVEIGNIKLLCYVDSGAADGTEFLEYKSGKKPWTQELVDDHEQLNMYALAYYIRSEQTVIPKCKLVWIETEETEDGLRYTGQVLQFERVFTEDDMVKMLSKILVTVQEIDEWEYNELELEDDLVDRYIEIQRLLSELKSESDTIKLEIQVQMDAEEMQYAVSTRGRFSKSKRGSWNYSKELVASKSVFDKDYKLKQKAEQKSGTAKQTFTESLRFSVVK